MRKVKYLVAALLLMGATTTFTSCIDNDEPAGITDLRGAKAELLRAKAAVELANAAFVEAQTQEKLVLVERQKLWNERIALNNQLKEAENAYKIDSINALLERNQLLWDAHLLKHQEILAKAQKAYNDAMEALKLSEEFLSQDVLDVLKQVQDQFEWAYNALYGDPDDANDKGAKGEMEDAYDLYESVVANPDNYIDEAKLNNTVAMLTATRDSLQAIQDAKKDALAVLLASDEYTAWENLREVYNAKKDSLERVEADKTNQILKIAAENKGLIDNLKTVKQNVEDVTTAKVAESDSTVTLNVGNIKNPDVYRSNVDFTGKGYVIYDAAKGEFKASFTNDKVLDLWVNPNSDSDKSDCTVLGDYEEYQYRALLNDVAGFADQKNSQYYNFVKDIDDAVKALEAAKEKVSENVVANDDANAEDVKKRVEEAKKASDASIKAWEDAVATYLADRNGGYGKDEFEDDSDDAQAFLTALANYGSTAADDNSSDKIVVTTLYNQFMEIYNKWISYGFDGAKDLKISTAKDFLTTLNGNVANIPMPVEDEVSFSNYDNVVETAKDAFGGYEGYGDEKHTLLILVQPAEDDAMLTGGAYKTYLDLKEDYEDLLKDVEVIEAYDEAIKKVTAWKTTLANARAAYLEKHEDLLASFTVAQKEVTDKIDTPIIAVGYEATKTALDTVVRILEDAIESGATSGDQINSFNTLVNKLRNEIGYLKGEYKENALGEYEYVEESTGLYKAIEDAEDNLLSAEKMLEMYKAGTLKEQYVIEWAEKQLEAAKQDYNKAVERLNYWSAKLEEMMEKIYNNEEVTTPDTPDTTPDETPEETPAE